MNPYWNLNFGIALAMAAVTAAIIGPLVWIEWRRATGARRWIGITVSSGVLVVLLPSTQWIVLEPINKHLLEEMDRRARAEALLGADPERARQLFGVPSSARETQPGLVLWKYRRPWGYLLGSSFEVHIEQGRVVGWEAFDD